MRDKNLHLYVDSQFTSPYAMSCYVALREKKLDFNISTLDLGAMENHDPDYAIRSITMRVPMLEHGNFTLSESSAITEYLDDMFTDTSVYPQDLALRARARQVQAWLHSDLIPIRQERSTNVVFYGEHAPALSPAAQLAAQKLFHAAEALLSGNTENIFDSWCIADTDLALMLNRLIINGDPVPEKLKDYVAHQWLRPGVQEWVAINRPLR
ncbi:MAG: glutathione transferase [Comamonas sp.]|jgi:glutathione S-transferase|uniref:glutathione transferase n=1 Tax=Comamonas sp. TaxID=34028 RepID=UPI00281C5121|nr:glutathione transferase [Comamonas sp.]MDR0214100.1 glutathione transferase [Comamonas sp.]